MRTWLIATLVIATGCASGRSPVSPPAPEAPEPEVVRERVLDRAALERAEDSLGDGDRGSASVIADSLWREWTGSPELDPESAEDLVDLLDAVG
ncbi:MAG: hypothetical protein WBP17_06205, partial [Gemmatimonadota bacterium]